MVPQPPLERSVLERKERDELATIAEAMGVKPSARASKSTLIDHILREAGIETAPEEKPRRPRVSKAAAAAAAAAARAGNGAEQPALSLDATGTAGTATPPASEPAPPADQEAPAAVVEAITEAPAAVAGPPTFNGSATVDVQTDTESQASSDGPDHQNNHNANNAADTQVNDAGPRTDDRPREGGPRPDHRPGGGQQPFDANDPANRRGRRRRGRERGERDIAPERGGQPDAQYQGEPIPVEGLLDLREEGFGFLRTNGYLASQHDVYVSLSQVRRFGLRKGDTIKGASRPAGSSEKYPALLRIDTVSGMTADEARQRPRFEDLTPLFPDEKLRLEVPGEPSNMVARIVDLVSPIGKGQRGLIVSPPKAGKTTVLKQIAHSIEANNPEVHLMVLLVDERPEEVTDMRRSVKGEVIASTFDRPSDEHTQVAELASERAKRLVEMGKDVVIVLDGITRLARAYNLAAPTTGRIMSGGLATEALYPPKKFFGSARNLEEGGSLTILATALIETGSKMDEVIFEEFKGTGNMELRLDRRLAERRIYPALEVNASSTRHEELLFPPNQLHQVWKLRRVLNALEPGAGLELLMDKIKHTKSNDEFLSEIAKAPS
ncbi:MAG: Transcription termination factor Rho [uncultured Acidimicrobiales bacterium]|uniref:Transcription termination factor Rho n=1 Tax=uncultured Acidimicrobiales bacterium TaxID=310071 RepID=A0A6J4I3U1_9ACTN|nr:MAG: Transcription termination factor Rho [uncultured Acidimicrobiales bacterium]